MAVGRALVALVCGAGLSTGAPAASHAMPAPPEVAASLPVAQQLALVQEILTDRDASVRARQHALAVMASRAQE